MSEELEPASRRLVPTVRWIAIALSIGFVWVYRYGTPRMAEDNPMLLLGILTVVTGLAIACAVILIRAVRRDLEDWRR